MREIKYLYKTVVTPQAIFCYKYYSLRYGKRGTRGVNISRTSDQQKTVNRRLAAQRRLWTICNNFRRSDYFITLTYRRDERPEDMDAAVRNAGRALARLSRILKRQGVKLSYYLMTERGAKGAVHHHILIRNCFDLGIIFSKKIWKHGAVQVKDIYTSSMLQLGRYFLKGDSAGSDKRYSQSRDIIAPKPKVEVIKAAKWRSKPRPKKGYDIIDIVDGVSEGFGMPYQEYIMVKRE